MKNKLQKNTGVATPAVEAEGFSFSDIITSEEVISIGYPRPEQGTHTAIYKGAKEVKFVDHKTTPISKCGVVIMLEIDGTIYYNKLNMFDEYCISRKGPDTNPEQFKGLFNKLLIALCKQWDVPPTGKALIDNIGKSILVSVGKYYEYDKSKMTTETDSTTTTEVPTSF